MDHHFYSGETEQVAVEISEYQDFNGQQWGLIYSFNFGDLYGNEYDEYLDAMGDCILDEE